MRSCKTLFLPIDSQGKSNALRFTARAVPSFLASEIYTIFNQISHQAFC